MDRRGGCCTASYAGAGAPIDRIMLRFRPIAPKPPPSPAGDLVATEDGPKSTRVKRRYVSKRRRKCSPENTDSSGDKQIKTLTLLPGRRKVVGSWVRVEGVTEDTCGLGRTDEERVRGLDLDTCPGFVSDGSGNVRWMNSAYRRMVLGEEGEEEVGAWIVVEEGVAVPVGWAAFTCRVRVVWGGNVKTVPCDVWRMECGGYAWRLDTAAALSLSLSLSINS